MGFLCPEEGGPHVEGILREGWSQESKDRADTKEGFIHRYKDSNASHLAEKL